jgi:hypothetical protein
MQIGMRNINKKSYVVRVKIQEHELVIRSRTASVVSEFKFLELSARCCARIQISRTLCKIPLHTGFE